MPLFFVCYLDKEWKNYRHMFYYHFSRVKNAKHCTVKCCHFHEFAIVFFWFARVTTRNELKIIEFYFLVPIMDSPIVGFLSPLIDSPIVFLRQTIDSPIIKNGKRAPVSFFKGKLCNNVFQGQI